MPGGALRRTGLLTDYLEILEQKESASAVPVPDQTEGEKDHGKG